MYKSKSYDYFYLNGKILIVTFMTVRREYVFKTFSIQTPRFVYVNNKAKIIRRSLNIGQNAKKPHIHLVVFLSLLLREIIFWFHCLQAKKGRMAAVMLLDFCFTHYILQRLVIVLLCSLDCIFCRR